MPGEGPSCFIDTNIWLYAFIEADDTAKSTIARGLIQETEPVVSTQVINEVCVNLLRRANFTEEQVSRLVESFYEKYQVIEPSRSVLLKASQLRQRKHLILLMARSFRCTIQGNKGGESTSGGMKTSPASSV